MQLTVRDVSKLFAVNEKTVYRWLQQSSLPGYRVNNQYRFNRAELLEWATAHRINVSVELFKEPESATARLGTIADAVKSGGIFYRLGGTDKASALRSIVEHMRLPEEVDREFLLNVLLAREALASTGIGDGIAIPHVRNPIVLHVPQPIITVCFLEKPVDFAALDGQKVYCLFTIVSPTARAHLHLLSRLSFVLRDAEFKAAIKTQAPREEILAHIERIETQLEQSRSAPQEDTQEH
jgi:PTS system nitrogen regulatory IIA component